MSSKWFSRKTSGILQNLIFDAAEYSITKVSPLMIKNDDIVTIQYTTTKAATNDWIGAYSPADIDITTTVPVKYGWCDDSPSYLATGVGALEFNFTNLRADIAFYYFTGGTSKPTTVAKASETVSFANKNEPLRPRVVPTGDVDKLKLLWSSASSTSPVLRWGVESGIYTSTVAAVSSRIDKSDMCGAPANTKGWRDLGQFFVFSKYLDYSVYSNTKLKIGYLLCSFAC